MKPVGTVLAALALLLLAAVVGIREHSARRTVPPEPPAAAVPGWTDFTLPDVSGKNFSLGEFLGKKPVLLIFWATWCPHCRESVPVINRLHADPSAGGGVQILAVDYMESRDKVNAFIESRKVAFPVLLDRKGNVAKSYRVVGIPTYILFDRSGSVVFRGYEIPGFDQYFK